MVLWGANTLIIIVEPGRHQHLQDALVDADRLSALGVAAKRIGLKVGTIFTNEGYQTHPANISFTYPAHNGGDFSNQYLVCPAKGEAYLEDVVLGPLLKRYAAGGLVLDYLIAWPYDWGGCGCAADAPWGDVGYPRFASRILERARRDWGHPRVDGILSTWHFQMGPADELTGLDQWLKTKASSGTKSNYTRVMSAVAGSWSWLEKNGPVGGLPTLDFPELSMFGRCPWGGFGANPIPAGLQKDWDEHGHLIQGGMPYTVRSSPSFLFLFPFLCPFFFFFFFSISLSRSLALAAHTHTLTLMHTYTTHTRTQPHATAPARRRGFIWISTKYCAISSTGGGLPPTRRCTVMPSTSLGLMLLSQWNHR